MNSSVGGALPATGDDGGVQFVPPPCVYSWRAHANGFGVEFIAPDGLPYQTRLELGRIDDRLHRFLGPFRGEGHEAGWRVWAPLEWKDRRNVAEDGTFRVLCFRCPQGIELAVEFHYRPGPPQLLEVLESLCREQEPEPAAAAAPEVEDGAGELQLAAEPEAVGRPAAEGPGVERAEVDQEGGALRWRPFGRRKQAEVLTELQHLQQRDEDDDAG